MLKILVPSALIISAAFAAAANADTVAPDQFKVEVSDLNLASLRGQAALDHRLAFAITRVCGSGDERNLGMRAEIRRCRDAARTSVAPRRAEMIAAANPTGGRKTLASR